MRRGSWARYAVERLRLLSRWREIAGIVAGACRELLGDECSGVYVVGGAAEGRLTVLSDIDVLVVVDRPGRDRLTLTLELLRRARELGAPEDAPLDIKVLTVEELEEHLRRGLYKRLVEVDGRAHTPVAGDAFRGFPSRVRVVGSAALAEPPGGEGSRRAAQHREHRAPVED